MRKTIFTLGLMLAAALSLTNCTKNEEATFTPEVKVPFELYANMDDTRTTNNGLSTEWAANDKINVFHAVAGKGATEGYVNDGKFTTDNGDGKFKGTLSKTLDAGSSYDWYAFYPYSSYVKTPASTSSGYMPIGCKSNEVQTQDGNNNTDHIAGPNYPLVGVKKNVPASEKPAITMSHASSLVEFVVKNGTGEDFVVESIAFTAPEDIVGTYYINFASEPVAYTKSGVDYVSSTATLTVDGGTDVPAAGAKFYMGIKPFTAAINSELTVNIETDKGTFAKTITLAKETTFSAGLIKTLTVNVNELVVPDEPEGETTTVTIDFSSITQRTYLSTEQQVWFNEGVTFTNNKSTSSNAVADYSDPVRLYMNSDVIISAPGYIYNISFKCANSNSATALDALSSSAKTDNNVVISLDGTSKEYTISALTAQIRLNSVSVTYVSDGSTPKQSQNLTFTNESVEVTLDDSDFTGQVVQGAKTTVTYESSNTDVATVDASTGAVTLVGAGTTTITATAADTAEYVVTSKSYTLTVNNPSSGDGDTATTGTVLWSEDFGSYGANSTSFTSNKTIAGYDYSGRGGFGDNATSVTLTADASNNVRCTTSSVTNCTSGHLWFNKSVEGTLTTSAIKLYGATSLSFSHSQGTSSSSCTSAYSTDGGSTWISLGTQSGPIATKEYTFEVPVGTESIQIRLSHPSSNSKNTRVDNLVLSVN